MNNYINQQLSQSIAKMSVTGSERHAYQTEVEKSIKIKIPDKYFEEWQNLNRFLLQCDLYIWHNQALFQNKNKSVFTAFYLHKDVFIWVQSHLKNFLKLSEKTWDTETWVVFKIFLEFKKQIYKLFEDIDAKRTDKRKMMSMYQKSSAVVYASKF